MDFGIEKYAILIMKSRKRKITEGIQLPNQERIRTLGKNGKVQILGNIGSGHHQTSGNEKITKGHLRRTRKLLKTKLRNGNLIKEINTWAIYLIRY